MDNLDHNYGVDILKCICMFMVVVLHVNSYAGGLSDNVFGTSISTSSWLLDALCYAAVDCFAMTTGYLMIDHIFLYRRVIPLWCQVLFYSVGWLCIFKCFFPNQTPTFGSYSFALYFAPAIGSRYWYFTAYFPLFFLIPFINKCLISLSKMQYIGLLVTILLLFSVLPTLWGTDAFRTNSGVSMIWLTCCYCFGGYIKKFGVPIIFRSCNTCFLLYLSCCLLTWISRISFPVFKEAFQLGEDTVKLYDRIFYQYVSPTTILEAFAMLCLFTQIIIQRSYIKKTVKLFGQLSFGVYLAHMHPLVKQYWLKTFIPIIAADMRNSIGGGDSFFATLIVVLGMSTVIFCIGMTIDLLRYRLFKMVGINRWVDIIADKVVSNSK